MNEAEPNDSYLECIILNCHFCFFADGPGGVSYRSIEAMNQHNRLSHIYRTRKSMHTLKSNQDHSLDYTISKDHVKGVR